MPVGIAGGVFLLIAGLMHVTKRGKNAQETLATWTDLVVGGAVLVLALAALPLILILPELPAPQRGTEVAVLVQPDISESADWTPQWIEQQHEKLLRLSAEAALKQPGRTPALIVWPEAPAPMQPGRADG